MIRDLSPLYGKHQFSWMDTSSGGVQGIIDDIHTTRSHGVCIKAADGVNRWAQFLQNAPALKAAGLLVGAWAYEYAGTDLQAEAEAICTALPMADYLVIDAETEYETPQGAQRAHDLGVAIRKLAPDAIIGYTTFGAPNLHPQFPYAEFAAWTDFVMPQVYWADFGINPQAALGNAVQTLSRYHQRIFPVGQAYAPATPAEIAEFSAACAHLWIEGVWWWDIQSSTQPLRDALAQTEVYVPQTGHVHNPKPSVSAQEYQKGYADGIKQAIKDLEGIKE